MQNKSFYLLLVMIFNLHGCDNSEVLANEQQTQELTKRSLDNMVTVKGGEFLMGDFGPLVGQKLPYSINSDDKKLHKVILDDFLISKYKVTNKDYKIYSNVMKREALPKGGLQREFSQLLADDVPVSVPWELAREYCLWLGKETGKKIDLPTEAQWEYAARSRGQYLPFATNDGNFSEGENVPTHDDIIKMTGFGLPIYPIGKYPPNPLGLYDMGLSGSEWVYDWYDKDYYHYSEEKNPSGPSAGIKKVSRGNVGGDIQYALTMFRQANLPVPVLKGRVYERDGISPAYVFRCAVNN